jgi:hypothetical protein
MTFSVLIALIAAMFTGSVASALAVPHRRPASGQRTKSKL